MQDFPSVPSDDPAATFAGAAVPVAHCRLCFADVGDARAGGGRRGCGAAGGGSGRGRCCGGRRRRHRSSIAWRLAAARAFGCGVRARQVGAGASLAATGMLAAAAEHEPGEPDCWRSRSKASACGRSSRQALEAASGIDIDYPRERHARRRARPRRGRAAAVPLRPPHAAAGSRPQWLGGARGARPRAGAAASVAAGLYCPDDHQVDPRRVMAALRAAAPASGARIRALRRRAARPCRRACLRRRDRARAAAAPVRRAGRRGVDRGKLLPAGLSVPVRPLKGQTLALTATADTGTLSHIVWTEQVHMRREGRRPADRRRHRRGARLRHQPHGRRAAGADRRRLARRAGDRGAADRRDLGRFPSGFARRRADAGRRAGSTGWSSPPGITATAFC